MTINLYFRELRVSDIPTIKELCKDIWEGYDYVPLVIDDWLKDENSYNYGAFLDEQTKNLIGFGRVKILSSDLAWLEGGRVRINYQGKGVGKLLIDHALNFIKKKGIKVAQYDTWSKNYASIALANKFGFHRKTWMVILEAEKKEIMNVGPGNSDFRKINAKQALIKYKSIPNGPTTELCIGWSFVPLDLKFLNNKNWTWFENLESIILRIKDVQFDQYEFPNNLEAWYIVHGDPKKAKDLLKNVLQIDFNNKNITDIFIFCHEKITAQVKELGFRYLESDDSPSGVVLFEKIIDYD